MSADARRALGCRGEAMAAQALEAAGLTILARNWRCATGEIDLIAQERAPDYSQGGTVVPWLVIVEVRTRRGQTYGSALASVTPAKQARLAAVGAAYVQAVEWRGPWRIDVVAIQMDGAGRLQAVEHIRHAVTG
ncbi:MAG: YraN family protein [Caldilineaceae bacterium]|nr:YraN family protein [Caldilineaceae bacterium]